MNQRTCRLVTLGCKVNQYETQLVKEALTAHGYREAREGEPADLSVVNTCTVTNTGDSKSRQVLRRIAREDPGTRTIVMGCYATRDPEAVSRLPNVVEVVRDKRELPDVLDRFGVVDMPAGISRFDGRQRAFVKVQDGCILKCSYCIIPHVRPGLVSRTPDSIEEEVRRLVDNGHREIVLSGIHVGHYGVERTRGKSGLEPFRLWHLFQRLDRIRGQWRMRLSSIEAAEVDDDFISAARDCEHLCPQFHPSLQSGSDTVLARMRRRYRIERFLGKIERMRDRLDSPTFTTDVIVGFPGETDAEFEETLAACRRARFLKTHVFPFSARSGTRAAEMSNQVDGRLRKERVDRLLELDRELARTAWSERIGHECEVLVERPCPDEPGRVRGTDERYVPIALDGTPADVGRLIPVVGSQVGEHGLLAERAGIESTAGLSSSSRDVSANRLLRSGS